MKRLDNQTGSTLVATLILLSALFVLTIAGLTASTSSLQVSGNYQQSAQALLAAETGVLHSVRTMNSAGVVTFADDVVALWSSFFGSALRQMPGHNDISYRVTPTADPTDPVGKVMLVSTGFAPRNAQRQVLVWLELDGAFSPGAIYLPSTTVDTNFIGNQFLVDGNDYAYPPADIDDPMINPDGETQPAIGVLNPANDAVVTNSLNNAQLDNLSGAGGEPSIAPVDGPTSAEIQNEIAVRILARPGVVTNPSIHGNDVFGTAATPKITHFTNSVTLNGSVTGTGILIADQGLTVTGDLEFVGLIIVRGMTDITSVGGNTTVLGAIWTTDISLRVAGSAGVFYSSGALEAMNVAFGGSILQQKVKISSWGEL